MGQIGKILIIMGIMLVLVGLLLQLTGKFWMFGRLPGDMAIEKKSFKFYFPLTTSLVISILLTLLLWIFKLFKH